MSNNPLAALKRKIHTRTSTFSRRISMQLSKVLPSRLITNLYVSNVRRTSSIKDWLLLIDYLHVQGLLSEREATLAIAHELSPDSYVVNYFTDEIQRRAGDDLKLLSKDPIKNIGDAINEMVKWKSTIQCADSHDQSKGYFIDAERSMDVQWGELIYPCIKDLDFSSVLDLACGHGRNSEKLRLLTKELHLVDINQSCLDACFKRFGKTIDGTNFHYHLTNGNELQSIRSESITLVYSWDSMVHFDKLIVANYVKEIARILVSGGNAFLHHSNYGSVSPDSDWAKNIGTRSDMSANLMRIFAGEFGLEIVKQEVQGRSHGWGADDLDCVSLLHKP